MLDFLEAFDLDVDVCFEISSGGLLASGSVTRFYGATSPSPPGDCLSATGARTLRGEIENDLPCPGGRVALDRSKLTFRRCTVLDMALLINNYNLFTIQ